MNIQHTYIVTMRRVKKNRDHDPGNKIIGECPLTGKKCTDITGNHHNIIISAINLQHAQSQANEFMPNWQVSRIEEV